jgi:hypothetical protein
MDSWQQLDPDRTFKIKSNLYPGTGHEIMDRASKNVRGEVDILLRFRILEAD